MQIQHACPAKTIWQLATRIPTKHALQTWGDQRQAIPTHSEHDDTAYGDVPKHVIACKFCM